MTEKNHKKKKVVEILLDQFLLLKMSLSWKFEHTVWCETTEKNWTFYLVPGPGWKKKKKRERNSASFDVNAKLDHVPRRSSSGQAKSLNEEKMWRQHRDGTMIATTPRKKRKRKRKKMKRRKKEFEENFKHFVLKFRDLPPWEPKAIKKGLRKTGNQSRRNRNWEDRRRKSIFSPSILIRFPIFPSKLHVRKSKGTVNKRNVTNKLKQALNYPNINLGQDMANTRERKGCS